PPCDARGPCRWCRGRRGRPARSLPSRDGHSRARAGLRIDVEVVDETAGTTEAEAEAGAGREAVAERLVDVRDAGALVLEDAPQAAPCAVVQRLEADGPATPVQHHVAGELAGRGHHLRLIHQAEAARDCPLAYGLTDLHDVVALPDVVGLM